MEFGGVPHWPDTKYKNVYGCSNYTAHYLMPKLMLKWYVSLIHALTNIHQSHYHLKNSVVYNDQCLARPWLSKTFLDILTTRKKRSNDKIQSLKTSKDFVLSHTRPPKFFQRGGGSRQFAYLFRLLTMQCKWTFTKRFSLSTPQRKWPSSHRKLRFDVSNASFHPI